MSVILPLEHCQGLEFLLVTNACSKSGKGIVISFFSYKSSTSAQFHFNDHNPADKLGLKEEKILQLSRPIVKA